MKAFEGAIELRHSLHRAAELSGNETRTAEIVREHLERLGPQAIITGLGGYGLAAVYESDKSGPRVLFRCELDALPIPEGFSGADASTTAGVSHKCGHDGHMAILAALAGLLHERPPSAGSVVLLFQPSEETGAGARFVLDDPRFRPIEPDLVFALHNLPGYPLGSVLLKDGVFASTARSIRADLEGRTSHAAEPQRGLSPAPALAEILRAWPGAADGVTRGAERALVTVVHARLGEPALGTSPGAATVIATLRAESAEVMRRLSERCVSLADGVAQAEGLAVRIDWLEEFPCTESHASANRLVEQAARDAGLAVSRVERPFGWTEDFGHFTATHEGAMFGLGAGVDAAPLHHPEYGFPDELVGIGSQLLRRVADMSLAERPLS